MLIVFVRTPFLHTDTTLQDQTLLTLIEHIKWGLYSLHSFNQLIQII
jgi:hypothetical protein